MADEMDQILRIGILQKRSLNKRKLAPVNIRSRVFVLTRNELIYFEGTVEKRGKEKGRINLSDIKVVEELDENAFERPYGVQVSYDDYTLYFFASSQKEQKEWLSDLQTACRNNIILLNRFHTGAHNTRMWTCCGQKHVGAPGCRDSYKHCAGATQRSAPFNSLPSHNTRQQGGGANGPQAGKANKGYGGFLPLSYHSNQHSLPASSPAHRQQNNGRSNVPLPKRPEEKEPVIVIARFDYDPLEDVDIPLVRGDEYTIIDKSREYWWKAKDKHGRVGYIPSNYIEEKSKFSSGLEKYEWFTGKWNRQRTEQELRASGKEGCFIVRNSSTKGLYTLSVLTKGGAHSHDDNVSHYHIKRTANNQYFVSEKHCFKSIPELIEYHQHNAGGLITRLKKAPGHIPPTTAGLGSGTLEIGWKDLTILSDLGSGQFGVVQLAKTNRQNMFVAVKVMRESAMSEDDFIQEAKVMTQLQHENLVQLYGVCKNPIAIITEYMSKGCLLFYIRRHQELLDKPMVLLYIVIQICSALAYLEKKQFIHRDLAARNCLVGERNTVKVADFGLTRYVLDDEYTSTGTKFPIKWASPEVLHFTKFSSKSDVWAYGILLWEIFSGGKSPYPSMNNMEVVNQVTRHHYRMDRPQMCPSEIYRIMGLCWQEKPEKRPPFSELLQMVTVLQDQESTDFVD